MKIKEPVVDYANDNLGMSLELGGITQVDETTAKPEVSEAEQRGRELESKGIPTEPDSRQDAIDKALDEGNVGDALAGMIEQQLDDGTLTNHGPQSGG